VINIINRKKDCKKSFINIKENVLKNYQAIVMCWFNILWGLKFLFWDIGHIT